MEKLAEALKVYDVGGTSPDVLRQAAKDWAANAIENYRGNLLFEAMQISIAIADFLAEIEVPKG